MKSSLLSILATTVIKLLRLTYKYELEFQSEVDSKKFIEAVSTAKPNNKNNILIAFFHQDELLLLPYFGKKGFSILVSISKDGEIMHKSLKRLGYKTVRGSSSKKAVAGLIASIKSVREGYNFSLAVDGPRGPIYEVKQGIIAIANKTQTPMIPIVACPQSFWQFEKSWNKAMLAKPFSKITLKLGSFDNYTKETLQDALLSLKA